MSVSKDMDLSRVEWVEWENRHGATVAHAVDPGSEQRTGIRRTVTGAIVASGAIPAKSTTAKDPFSLQVLERIAQVQAERAAKQAERDAEAAKRAAAKAEKLAERAAKTAESAAAREAKAKAKEAEKAAREAERAKAALPVATPGSKLKKSKDQYLVMNGEEQVGAFAAGLLDTTKGSVVLTVTDKVWVVTQIQGTKAVKVAQGAIAAPKPAKAAKAK